MLTTFLTLMTGFATGAILTAVAVSVGYLTYRMLETLFGDRDEN